MTLRIPQALAIPMFLATFAMTSSQAQDAAPTTQPKPMSVDLTLAPNSLDMEHLKASKMGFMPGGVKLVEDKPAAVTKEPSYMGKPMYGVFCIGNGAKNLTYFAVDETPDKAGKLYVDTNQNGDLMDDGPGDWDIAKPDGNNGFGYRKVITVHASWGSPLIEEDGGPYSLYLYRRSGQKSLGYCKTTGRAGSLTLGEKTYSIILAENTNDGNFTVPANKDRNRRPVELYVDIDGDGTFKGYEKTVDDKKYVFPERFSLTDPIELDGQWYLVRPTMSGANLAITKSTAPDVVVANPTTPTAPRIVLSTGDAAPDFTAKSPDGKPVSLSEYQGKVVIIDFWATWCGPCQVAMPGLQKIYDDVKDQGVVVLSLNVFDEKDKFDAWILKHSGKDYNFTFAIDPASKEDKNNIATSKFGVSVLPTMFVIGRDGKIVGKLAGSGNDANLTKILNEQGIKTKE